MTFNTTEQIIADIIQTVRNNTVNQTETLSHNQIESWLFNYRALLLKQDADKGRPIDPWNIQTIPNIPLIVVDMGEIQLLGGKYGQQVRSLNTGRKLLRTKFKVPKMIDLNYGTSLIVYNPVGEEIQLIPKSRVTTVRNKRWTGKELYCYLDNNYLFIEGPDMIHYATISGVFEDPFELVEYGLWSSTAKFPLPMNLIPTLKQMIFANDLRILLPNPIDQTNDNVISLSPPSDGPANYVPRTYPGPAGGINAARAAAVGPGPERNNEIMPNGYRNPKII